MGEVKIKRLRELAKAVTQGREAVLREFTMRVPAEPDRDADLVISWAADHIKNLEECSMLKAYWELQGRIKELEAEVEAQDSEIMAAIKKRVAEMESPALADCNICGAMTVEDKE